MNRKKITRPRLRMAAVAAGLGALAIGAVLQWSGLGAIGGAYRGTIHGDLALAEVGGLLSEDILQLRRYEKDIFIHIGDSRTIASYRARWDSAYTDFRRDLLRARSIAPGSAQVMLQAVTDSVARYRSGFESTVDGIERGDITTTAAANEAMNRYKDSIHAGESEIAGLRALADSRIARLDGEVARAEESSRLGLLLLIGAAVGIAVVLLRAGHLPVRESAPAG